MLVGYARVSTVDQIAGLEAQERDLRATGCQKILSERVSSVAQRDQLAATIEYVREGDTVVVTRLDRLARSTIDLLGLVAKLEAKGVGVRVLDFGGGGELDTKSASGRLLMTVLAAVAEAERTMMLERQRVGIAKAKVDGKYPGRQPTAQRVAPQVRQLKATGLGAGVIAAQLKVSRSSVYRILAESSRL